MNSIASIREDSRRHLAFLFKHYRKQDREWMRRHGKSLCCTIKNAVEDVCVLEAAASRVHLAGGFWHTFKKSTSQVEFVSACIKILNLRPDAKLTKGIMTAADDDEFRSEFLLFKIREKLRDGWRLADILTRYAEQIERELRDLKSWQKLARAALSQPAAPSAQSLMFRAWLPLALWESIPMSSKESRLRHAYGVCKADEMSLPEWPRTKNEGQADKIEKLIADTVSKLNNGKR